MKKYQVKLWSSQLWTQFLQLRREQLEKPEKSRTSTWFEPVTSRYRCDALTNWAMKPLTLGAGHCSREEWINDHWNDIWIGSYMNCGYEINWSYDLPSCERNFCNCHWMKKYHSVRNRSSLGRNITRIKKYHSVSACWMMWIIIWSVVKLPTPAFTSVKSKTNW